MGEEEDGVEEVVDVVVVVGSEERMACIYAVDASSIFRAFTPLAISRESSVRRDLNLWMRWSKSEIDVLEALYQDERSLCCVRGG